MFQKILIMFKTWCRPALLSHPCLLKKGTRKFLSIIFICALSINFIATQILISFVREWYFYGGTLNYLLCSIHLVTLWHYLGMYILLIVIMSMIQIKVTICKEKLRAFNNTWQLPVLWQVFLLQSTLLLLNAYKSHWF